MPASPSGSAADHARGCCSAPARIERASASGREAGGSASPNVTSKPALILNKRTSISTVPEMCHGLGPETCSETPIPSSVAPATLIANTAEISISKWNGSN